MSKKDKKIEQLEDLLEVVIEEREELEMILKIKDEAYARLNDTCRRKNLHIEDLQVTLSEVIDERDELEVSLEGAQIILASLESQNVELTEVRRKRDAELQGLATAAIGILEVYDNITLSPKRESNLEAVLSEFLELKEELDG